MIFKVNKERGKSMKVGFVSLGCSKNLVVTEEVIGMFQENGFQIVSDANDSDIIVINTCGFIESAKQEAIDCIFEMATFKQKKCKCLIVIGCLVERYKKELERLIPEVDLFIAIKEYDTMWEKIKEILQIKDKTKSTLDFTKRVITTGKNFAYLKIAEGCSNFCTYCAIPYIQGKYVSRTKEEILEEAKILAGKGIKELILIAQDTGRYGVDIYGKEMLPELLRELCKIDGFRWIRFLYTYPETVTDELLKVMKEESKICHYLDIPLQHISDPVLKKMNRKTNEASIKAMLEKVRQEIPDIVLRTTLIVGFPGETKEDFEKLYHFVEKAKFDKLGSFIYSKEDGTPAAKMDGQVHFMSKKARRDKIMKLQKEISKKNLETKIGKTYDVMIENLSFDKKYYIRKNLYGCTRRRPV